MAGTSVRTLHYYDEIGLLKPKFRSANGYRQYGEEAIVRLQQIMFFRELDFSLDDIKIVLSQPDFEVLEALHSHKVLLFKRKERLNQLIATAEKTINKINGETKMEIKEYYKGFSDEQIEKYREEVRQKWGNKTLQDSEARVKKMAKKNSPKFEVDPIVRTARGLN